MVMLARREMVLATGAGFLLPAWARAASSASLRAQTLVIAVASDPVGLEPAVNRAEPIGSEIILNVFDTLVAWGDASQTMPEPRLARSWTVSPDGCVTTFQLRTDVSFHDGTACDAEAVKFSLDRSLAQNSYTRASLDAVQAVTVTGRWTVEIRLSRPIPFLLTLLAQPQAAIVSPTAVRSMGAAFANTPVGSGPFRIRHYDPDVSLILDAVPTYFRGAPGMRRIVYLVIADASTRRLMLENGDLDICQQNGQLSALPMEDLKAYRRNPAIQVIEAPSQIMRQLEFNNRAAGGPTRDLRVRRAMALAVDYDGLIGGVMDGTVDRAYGPLPSSNWAFDPTMERTAFRYDPGQARRLLREAGYAPGSIHLTLYTFQGSLWATVATFLQANFAAVGLDVRIEQVEFPSLRTIQTGGHFEVALDGREAWYNDPDAHITIGYLSSLSDTAMTFRMPPDRALDGLILEAQSCPDPVRRKALYGEIQHRIMDRVPGIYLFSNRVIVFARADIRGLKLSGAPPLTEYRSVRRSRVRPWCSR